MLITLEEFDSTILINSSFDSLTTFLSSRKPYSSAVIISDSNVFPLFGSSIITLLKTLNIPSIASIVLDAGESSKSIDSAKACWQELHAASVDRQSLIIGLGGGVITDLAGFVAACYMRGIDVIHIPTTLMGMVDAAIGGKTAVNITGGKNIVGALHQPKLVLIVPQSLQSLPEREYVAGLAEVIKYGIIVDPDLFEMLENNTEAILVKDPTILEIIIQRCCKAKADIVHQDEKEHGLRAILNLGHTFAHAIETSTHYTSYLHGEAVAIGMSCAFYTSHSLGFINKHLINRLHNLLKKLKLPIALPLDSSPKNLLNLMYGDKKTVAGQLNLVLVKQIGKVELVQNVSPQLILDVLNYKIVEKP